MATCSTTQVRDGSTRSCAPGWATASCRGPSSSRRAGGPCSRAATAWPTAPRDCRSRRAPGSGWPRSRRCSPPSRSSTRSPRAACRVEQPVVDLLPPERRPSTLRDDVTVHHLLCHTSGIADYAEEDEDTPGYVEDYAALWRDLPCYRVERPADFLPLFGDRPPYRPPGERYQYSNAGFVLLGLVLEDVTGRAYTDVVQERVLDRAGMRASGFLRLDEANPDVAVGYLPRSAPDGGAAEGPERPWRTNVHSIPVVGGPDGGAFATARDLDRFLLAYDDGTLLGDLRDVALHPHVDMDGTDGFRSGYGVHLYPDGRYGHGGGDPGVEVLIHRWPADDLDLVVLCNGEGLAGPVRDETVAALRA